MEEEEAVERDPALLVGGDEEGAVERDPALLVGGDEEEAVERGGVAVINPALPESGQRPLRPLIVWSTLPTLRIPKMTDDEAAEELEAGELRETEEERRDKASRVALADVSR